MNDSIGYDLPSTNSKRTTGFGFGNRHKTPKKDQSGKLTIIFFILIFIPNIASPDPGAYELKGGFNRWVPGTILIKGRSFGISRDFSDKVYEPKSNLVPASMRK